MKKYSRGELAKEILKGLALGGFIVACFAMPGFAQVATLFKAKSNTDQYRLKQSLNRLIKRRLVKVYEKNGKDVVEITEQGRKRVLQYGIDDVMVRKEKSWDRLWRVIMFDIPESKKRARNAISLKIREMGMLPIQKSTFITPYSCKNEIDFIGEYYNVRKYIIYMEVREIDIANYLRGAFKL